MTRARTRGSDRSRRARARALGAAASLAALAGCFVTRGSPVTGAALVPPPGVVLVTASAAPPLRFGEPLESELAVATSRERGDALALRIRFIDLPDVPRCGVASAIEERAEAIIDPQTGELSLAPVVATGALALDGTNAEELLAQPRAALAADTWAALPRDTTVRVALRTERASPPVAGPSSRDVEPAPRQTEELAILARRVPVGHHASASSGRELPGTSARRRAARRETAAGAARLADASPEQEMKTSGTAARVRAVPPLERPEEPCELDLALELRTTQPPPAPAEPEDEEAVPEPRRKGQRREVRKLLAQARGTEGGLSRELIGFVPHRLLAPRGHLAWVVPSPFSAAPQSGTWVAIVVDIMPEPPAGRAGAGAHARARDAIDAALASERARLAGPPSVAAPPWHVHPVDRTPLPLGPIRETLEHEPVARAALATLGNRAGAGLLTEAALACPDPVVTAIQGAVLAALARRDALRVDAAWVGESTAAALGRARRLGLELDLAALEALVRASDRAPVRGLVERLYGVAFEEDLSEGGRPLLPRAALAVDRSDLDHLVVTRNLVALDDARPGVRVRAARWLATRLPGLEGYDPLAPIEERRGALDRLWALLGPKEGRP